MQCAAFNLDQSIERFQQLSSGDTSSEGRAESSVITASSPTEDTEKGLLVSAPSTPGPIPSYLSSQETSRAKLAQVFHSFESLLLKPTEVWINECQQMKCHVLEYTKVHHNYDHYTRKVLVLRGRGDKMDNNNNNNNKSKAMEKLVRNEQKLIQATTEYHEASSKIIHKLNEFISHQDQIILPLLQRVRFDDGFEDGHVHLFLHFFLTGLWALLYDSLSHFSWILPKPLSSKISHWKRS